MVPKTPVLNFHQKTGDQKDSAIFLFIGYIKETRFF